MSVALAGNAPTTFEIKSANLPLVALMLKSTDLDRLAQELAQRFGDMPDFFDNDPLVVDLHPLTVAEANALDFAALQTLLRQYRLQPLAVRGGTIEQTGGPVRRPHDAPDALVQAQRLRSSPPRWRPRPSPFSPWHPCRRPARW